MELITNGYFESGLLEPWVSTSGDLVGGVVADNPIFISSHNLKLLNNDSVEQTIPATAQATENLSLWVRWRPTGYFEHVSVAECGYFEASVHYSEGDSSRTLLNLDWLKYHDDPVTMLDPKHVSVAVDFSRQVERVQLRTLDAEHPWFVAGISMEGELASEPAPEGRKGGLPMGMRVAALERRLARIERFLTVHLDREIRPIKGVEPKGKD